METLDELDDAYDRAELLRTMPKGVDPDVPTKERLEEVGATPKLDPDGFAVDMSRPVLKNEDGSIATEESITVQGYQLGQTGDQRYYNIPSIVGGQRVSKEEAIFDAHQRIKAGEVLPNYETEPEAIKGAKARSKYLGSAYQQRMEMIEKNKPTFMEQGGFFDRTIVSGITTGINQSISTGYDLTEFGLESMADSLGIQYIDPVSGEPIPTEFIIQLPEPPQFDNRTEAQGFAESMLKGIVQFGTGFLLSRKVTQSNVGASALSAGAFFDPKDGGLVQAMQSGLGMPMLEYLNTASDADLETAEGRLRTRLQFVLEDLGIVGVLGGIVESLKLIRKSPTLMRMTAGALAASGLVYSDETEAGVGTVIKRLTAKDNLAISNSAKSLGLDRKATQAVKDEAKRIIANYPESDGWMRLQIKPTGVKKDGSDSPSLTVNKKGKIKFKWNVVNYGYEKPPARVSYARHQQNMADRIVKDVNDVVTRAKNGDQAAKDILEQANWYRSMRTRLRTEFGGLGDVFADLLGATSANTDVRTNWNNGIDVLRRFTNGDFDQEIQMYIKRLEAGEPVDPATLTKMHKDGEFKLLAKATGELYGINSPAAMKALLDMFRQIKPGSAPKTINFTGNLIGFGSQPTIDVWAARYLRDAAGLPRIPPPAEKAVMGKHITGSTIDNPIIGKDNASEFGFGQRVITDASETINSRGFVKDYDGDIGDLGPDDLQAVLWFIEKEKWAKNGWTNKAGEGGSLDFEANLAGSPERVEIHELRETINSSKSTPQQKEIAEARLEELKAPVDRRVAGISRERPNQRPTNQQQAELSSEVLSPLKDDPSVVAQQANNSYGVFGGTPERSLNTEIVTRSDFDETNFVNNIVDLGRKYDQDAVYVSKVVPEGTSGAMPGVEIFFKNRQEADRAIAMIDSLRQKYDIGGGTIITDARYKDRPDVQVQTGQEVGGAVGVRLQYIPEFEGGSKDYSDAMRKFTHIADDLVDETDVSSVNIVFFENKVFKNTDREGAEWIEGGVSYEDSVRNRNGDTQAKGQRRESPSGQDAESATDG